MSKFLYHVPDLALTSWFYNGSASPFNGKYSLFGTLTAAAPTPPPTPPC